MISNISSYKNSQYFPIRQMGLKSSSGLSKIVKFCNIKTNHGYKAIIVCAISAYHPSHNQTTVRAGRLRYFIGALRSDFLFLYNKEWSFDCSILPIPICRKLSSL